MSPATSGKRLSAEDTDLIEVTLNTLIALDKLLHLLRSRSETLDLMGLRLTWEEKRIAAWQERRKILSDLNTFLDERARWSVQSAMSASATETPSHKSSASISVANLQSPRLRHAQALSHEAAQYGPKLVHLNQALVLPAGSALDKLIEARTVPEALLDEQDRVENSCDKDLEGLGKFAMSVVTQWQRFELSFFCTILMKI